VQWCGKDLSFGGTKIGRYTTTTREFTPLCHWIFGQKQHDSGPSASLLPRFGSGRLFPLPKAEIHIERTSVWHNWWQKKKCTRDLKSIPEEAFQKAFASWKKRWERCVASQTVFWRGQTWIRCTCCNKVLFQQSGLFLNIPFIMFHTARPNCIEAEYSTKSCI